MIVKKKVKTSMKSKSTKGQGGSKAFISAKSKKNMSTKSKKLKTDDDDDDDDIDEDSGVFDAEDEKKYGEQLESIRNQGKGKSNKQLVESDEEDDEGNEGAGDSDEDDDIHAEGGGLTLMDMVMKGTSDIKSKDKKSDPKKTKSKAKDSESKSKKSKKTKSESDADSDEPNIADSDSDDEDNNHSNLLSTIDSLNSMNNKKLKLKGLSEKSSDISAKGSKLDLSKINEGMHHLIGEEGVSDSDVSRDFDEEDSNNDSDNESDDSNDNDNDPTTEGAPLSFQQLLKPLQKSTKLGNVQKQLQSLDSMEKTPLATTNTIRADDHETRRKLEIGDVAQLKIERNLGYENTKKTEARKWDRLVMKNRESNRLMYGDEDNLVENRSIKSVAAGFEFRTADTSIAMSKESEKENQNQQQSQPQKELSFEEEMALALQASTKLEDVARDVIGGDSNNGTRAGQLPDADQIDDAASIASSSAMTSLSGISSLANPRIRDGKIKAQMQHLRTLMLRELERSKRIKKIKSKSFSRMQKKVDIKEREKILTRLESEDPELATKLRKEMEEKLAQTRNRRSVEARRKWARSANRFGGKEIGREISKQAQTAEDNRRALERALKGKSHGGLAEEDSDDDGDDKLYGGDSDLDLSDMDNNSDNENMDDTAKAAKLIRREMKEAAEFGSTNKGSNNMSSSDDIGSKKGLLGMKFMQKGMEQKRLNAKNEAEQLLKELEGWKESDKKGNGDSDSDDENEKRQSKRLKEDDDSDSDNESGSESGTEGDSENEEENEDENKKAKTKTSSKKFSKEALALAESAMENKGLLDLDKADVTNTSSVNNNNINVDKNTIIKPSSASVDVSRLVESAMAAKKSNTKSMKRKRPNKSDDNDNVINNNKDDGNDTASEADEEADPNPLRVQNKLKTTSKNDNNDIDSDNEDDSTDFDDPFASLDKASKLSSNAANSSKLRAAFATTDSAQQDFDKEIEDKLQSKRDEELKEVEKFRGWGSWAGEGINESKQRERMKEKLGLNNTKTLRSQNLLNVMNPTATAFAGKDKKFSEKYEVQNMPHPYQCKLQYETALQAPTGSEWNTSEVHKYKIAPKIVTRLGAVVKPLSFVKHGQMTVGERDELLSSWSKSKKGLKPRVKF